MKKTATELIMLGTGNATVTKCYNTCFIIKTEETLLLVDAGGGNGILTQLEKAQVQLADIHEMYVTHAHTDHILGAVWVVRMVIQRMLSKRYTGTFNLYSHAKVLQVLDYMLRMMLSQKQIALLGKQVLFHEIADKNVLRIEDMELQCFDILSTKEKQFGFRALLPDGKSLVCLGDEPYNESNRQYVENADWLLCEAFCLYEDREIFKPYEKHHSTALEAGRLAEELNVKNLLLYHTEDSRLDTRKKDYTAEASLNFSGFVVVPDDLEKISLK